ELWKSEPPFDAAHTTQVEDIYGGASNGFPDYLTNVGGTLFFRASNGTNGNELWKSEYPFDDTSTTQVKDIRSGPSSGSYPYQLANLGDTLFFAANNGSTGVELWKSEDPFDGTSTTQVKDINTTGIAGSSIPRHLTNVSGTLFFYATDGIN